MNKLKMGLFVVFALLGVCFISVGMAQIIRNGQKSQEAKTEEATVIQEGIMTDRQKEHGRLFKGYGVGKKISDLLRDKEEISVIRGLPDKGSYPGAPQPTLNGFVQEATCNSDRVIIGTVLSKSSQLTSDGDFVFTDYTISIETILKNSSNAPIQLDSNIIVARPGGKVKLNGHIVTAVDKSNLPLFKGEKYLLFLKSIPLTGAYTTLEGTNSVSAANGKLQGVTDEKISGFLDDLDSASAMEMIKASASICASNL